MKIQINREHNTSITDLTSHYTNEELEIFNNYFIKKGSFCNVHFTQYLENFIRNNGVRLSEEEIKEKNLRIGMHQGIASNISHWKYTSKNILVNNELNDNIVTYITANPKFYATNARLRDLNKLHPNWNHINSDGNNVLHLLTRNNISFIERLIDELELDPTVKNNQDEYFINLLLNPDNFHIHSKENMGFIIHEIGKLETTRKLMSKYIDLLGQSSLTNLEKMSNNLDYLNAKMLEHIDRHPDLQHKSIVQFHYETYKDLKDMLTYYILDKKVLNDKNNIVRNKM